jgi:hypothetical protein
MDGARISIKGNAHKWFLSDCTSSNIILLEDIDGTFGEKVGWNVLKEWGDKYEFAAEVKGVTVSIQP